MWSKNARYLDYNAGAGLSAPVRKEIGALLEQPEFFAANPSSRHRLGQRMQHLLYRARVEVARSLGAPDPDQILFTSSGTEANQTVLRSAIERGAVVLIGAGEHSASYDLLSDAFSASAKRAKLPLLRSGQYDLDRIPGVLTSLRDFTPSSEVWLSLFWANNETGVLTDLAALGATLERLRREFPQVTWKLHLDGAQVWGKVTVDVNATPADYVTFSAHKIGAPAGTGILWSRRKLAESELQPLLVGTQSQGYRGGTENWLGIFATGVAAAQVTPATVREFQTHTARLRDHFEQALIASRMPVTIWGAPGPRVSNTSRFSLDAFRSYENWVELLDLRGFAVSHGSACKAQVIEPSRVLLEMGATREQALNSIRVSFGPDSEVQDADDLVAQLGELYHNKLKSQHPHERA